MKPKNDANSSQVISDSSPPRLLCYEDGVYQGYFHNNYRSGLGIFVWHTGEFFFGEWKEDKISGEGLVFFSDGSYAHSFFSNNKSDGTGFLRVNSQDVFMGYWKNGSLDGLCYIFNINENVWFLCEYHDGILNSCIEKGVGLPLSFPSSKKPQKPLSDLNLLCDNFYKGKEIGDNKLSCFSFSDGAIYLGSVSKSLPHGLGLFRFSDGKVHLGFYENGVLSGFCNAHFQNGDFFAGQVKGGRYEGEGLLWNAQSGEWLHGKFHEGKLVSQITSSTQANFKLIESINKGYLKDVSKKTMRSRVECEFFSMPERKARRDLENMLELRTLLHEKNPMEPAPGSKNTAKQTASVSPKKKSEFSERNKKNLAASTVRASPLKASTGERWNSKSPGAQNRNPGLQSASKANQLSSKKPDLISKSKLGGVESPKKSMNSPLRSSLLTRPSNSPSINLGGSATLTTSVRPKYIKTEEDGAEEVFNSPDRIVERLTQVLEELKTNEAEYLKYVAEIKEKNLDRVLKGTLSKKKEKILENIEILKQSLLQYSWKKDSDIKRSVVEETQTFIQRLRSEESERNEEQRQKKRSITPKGNRTSTFETTKDFKKALSIAGKPKAVSKTAQSSIDIRRSRNIGSNSSVNSSEKKSTSKKMGHIYNMIISSGTRGKGNSVKKNLNVNGFEQESISQDQGKLKQNAESDTAAFREEKTRKENQNSGTTFDFNSKISSVDSQIKSEKNAPTAPIIYEENQAEMSLFTDRNCLTSIPETNRLESKVLYEEDRRSFPASRKTDEKSFEEIKMQIKQLSENIQNNIKDIVKILPAKNSIGGSPEKPQDITPAFRAQGLLEPQSIQNYLTPSPSGSRIIPVAMTSPSYVSSFGRISPMKCLAQAPSFSQPYVIEHPKVFIQQMPPPLFLHSGPQIIPEERSVLRVESNSPMKKGGVSFMQELSAEFSSNPLKNLADQSFQQQEEKKLFSAKKSGRNTPETRSPLQKSTREAKQKTDSPVYLSLIDTKGIPSPDTYLRKSQIQEKNKQEGKRDPSPQIKTEPNAHHDGSSDFQSDCEQCAIKALENCPVCKMSRRIVNPSPFKVTSFIRPSSPIRVVRYNEKNEPFITYMSNPVVQKSLSTNSLITENKALDNLILRTPPRVLSSNMVQSPGSVFKNLKGSDISDSSAFKKESPLLGSQLLHIESKPLISLPGGDSRSLIFAQPGLMNSSPIKFHPAQITNAASLSPGPKIIRQNSQDSLGLRFTSAHAVPTPNYLVSSSFRPINTLPAANMFSSGIRYV